MSLYSPEVWLGVGITAALGWVGGYLFARASMAYRARENQRRVSAAFDSAKSIRVPESVVKSIERVFKADFVVEGSVDIVLEPGQETAVSLEIRAHYKITNVGHSAKDYQLPSDTSHRDMKADRATLSWLKINGERVNTSDSRHFVIEPGSYSSRSLGPTIPINPGESASIEFSKRREMQESDSLTWCSLNPAADVRVQLSWGLDLRISVATLGPSDLLSSDGDDSVGRRAFVLSGLLPGQGFVLAWERSANSEPSERA